MKSSLEILGDCIKDYLKSLAEFKYADISNSQELLSNESGKAEGLKIEILNPLPIKTSKYTAGTTFSEVEICIIVHFQKDISKKLPSSLFFCETVSKALNNWTPPLKCGYGKLSLAQNYPWKILEAPKFCSRIEIKFKTQSLIQ